MPDDRSLDALATFARGLAREVGAYQRSRFGPAVEMRLKGAIDPVTQVDVDSERLIVQAIADAFPDHDVLTEEGSNRDSRSAHRWIVDPLDGTTNYLHGFPAFAVSIGIQNIMWGVGQPIAGALADR
jgi:myo-inositol-1(or 4)-monophosphatase